MHPLKQSLILLLSLFLHLHNISAADIPLPPPDILCSPTSTNYTANGPFSKNLNQSLAQLIVGTPCSGFGLSSVGSGTNKVNALAQCRGDLNSTECSTCITTALARVQKYCPFKKNATIWHGKCFLRYSENDFFGEVDDEVKFKIWSIIQNETLPSEFSMQVMEMMSSLRETVRVPLFFASKVMEVVLREKKLYGLAQCNRDLSSEDCDDCLEILIAALPNATRGASVENWTCNVRYELYPFFKI